MKIIITERQLNILKKNILINELVELNTPEFFEKNMIKKIRLLLEENDNFKFDDGVRGSKDKAFKKAIKGLKEVIDDCMVSYYHLDKRDMNELNYMYEIYRPKPESQRNSIRIKLFDENIQEKDFFLLSLNGSEFKEDINNNNLFFNLLFIGMRKFKDKESVRQEKILDIFPYKKTEFEPDDELSFDIEKWLFTYETLEKFLYDFLVENVDDFEKYQLIIDENIDKLKNYVDSKFIKNENLEINPIDYDMLKHFNIKKYLIPYIEKLIKFNNGVDIFDELFVELLGELKIWMEDNW